MNFLDWCLVVLVLAYAVSGYWQGFITGAFATAGLLLGGLVGIWLAPILLGDAAPSLWVSLGALFVVLVMASLGQAILQYAGTAAARADHLAADPGRRRRRRRGPQHGRRCWSSPGCSAWRSAARGSRGSATQVRDSRVLVAVNNVMPVQAQQALRSFDHVVGSSFFPRYLEPFAPERIVKVAARRGRGAARPRHPAGRRVGLQAPQQQPLRQRGRGHRLPLRAPQADDQRPRRRRRHRADGAWSATEPLQRHGRASTTPTSTWPSSTYPGLDGPTVHFDLNGKERQQGAVLGYPQDGPFDAQPARIRSDQRLRSPDIYGNGTVTRHVFSRARADPAGQLRRPARLHRRAGARRGLRRVGQRPAAPATR